MRLAAPAASVLIALLGACGGTTGLTDVTRADGGTRDAAVATDVGPAPRDASVPPRDSGREPVDAGPEPVDAGRPRDAGPPRECAYDSLDTWTSVEVDLPAAYRYLWGATVGGRLRVLAETRPPGPPHVLDLDVVEGVPEITSRVVLPGPHVEPYGFASNSTHFVAFTREVETNAIWMRVYELDGSMTDERSFGIGSFITATAALTDDGAVTLGATISRGAAGVESVVERRALDGTVEFTETLRDPAGEPWITLALRGGRVELARGDQVYEVTASGITPLRALTWFGIASPYSDGWFGIVGDEDELSFRFEPEVGAPSMYSTGATSLGGGPFLAFERSAAIFWTYGAFGNVLGVVREGALRTYRAPLSAPGFSAVPFAGPTDVGIFYGTSVEDPPRAFHYWGLHCPP